MAEPVFVDVPSESDYNAIPSYSDGFEGVDAGTASEDESKPDLVDPAEGDVEDEHKANVMGKSPEEKKAEDEAKKAALEDAVPEPKEGTEAPPAGKEAVEEEESVEVEWPEDHSETVLGIPDYAASGWEGDDVGDFEDFGDEDGDGGVDQVFLVQSVFGEEVTLKS